MRSALLLLVLATSCATGQSTRELLTPDQLHLYYTLGSGDSSGNITGGRNDPWQWGTNGDTDYSAITAGLSWNLTRPSGSREMERALRAMTIAANLMAASVEPPEPSAVPQPPPVTLQLPPILEEYLTMATRARPATTSPDPAPTTTVVAPAQDISITVQGGDQTAAQVAPVLAPTPAAPIAKDPPGSDDPQGVLLLGLSNEVWLQIIGVLSILATALGTYLGRERIPVLKNHTKKGKAAKKAAEEG